MELVEYLKQAVADRASDLFIVAGGVVSEKAEGRLRPIGTEKVFPARDGAPDLRDLQAGKPAHGPVSGCGGR